jgi:hypothetical protein
MALPISLTPLYEKLPAEAQISVKRDYEKRKKSMVIAYVPWFILG